MDCSAIFNNREIRSKYNSAIYFSYPAPECRLKFNEYNNGTVSIKKNLHGIKTQDTFSLVAMIGIICLHMHFVLYTLNTR